MSKQQQMPVPGELNVQDLFLEYLHYRFQLGEKKYGTSLETFNGRNALRDALDEATDLALYLQQKVNEQEEETRMIRAALELVDQARAEDKDYWRDSLLRDASTILSNILNRRP